MPSSPEVNRIKVGANRYAQDFLVQKYHDEYRELYEAYLLDRGVTPMRKRTDELVDEREILKARTEGKTA